MIKFRHSAGKSLVSDKYCDSAEEYFQLCSYLRFKMKLLLFLIFNILCVKCSLILNMEKSDIDNKTVILNEIISNYLLKYFNNEKVFVSIVLSSSNNHQKYLQADLIGKLMMISKVGNFSFNVLNAVDQSRQGNIKVFNLIIVVSNVSLR